MKKLVIALVMILAVASTAEVFAKCYHFQNTPSDVYVCVGRNGSDSSSDRNRARDICNQKVGNCGGVSSYSSSCHSNSGKCYDENGNASRDLNGY